MTYWVPRPFPPAIELTTQGDTLNDALSGTSAFVLLGGLVVFVGFIAAGFRYVRRLGSEL